MHPRALHTTAVLGVRPRLTAALLPTLHRLPAARYSSHGPADPHASTAGEEQYPSEGFSTPFWRNTFLVGLAAVGVYKLAPADTFSAGPENEHSLITRYIQYHTPDPKMWQRNADQHLALAKEAADVRLILESGERPKVQRLRYLGTFDQASPYGIPVGSQADLSGLRIKSEKEDFAVQE